MSTVEEMAAFEKKMAEMMKGISSNRKYDAQDFIKSVTAGELIICHPDDEQSLRARFHDINLTTNSIVAKGSAYATIATAAISVRNDYFSTVENAEVTLSEEEQRSEINEWHKHEDATVDPLLQHLSNCLKNTTTEPGEPS